MENSLISVQVHRIYKLANSKYTKAFVDIIVNGEILIRGIRVVDGKNGLFVSMPQEQSKDKKWYDTVRCLNKEVRQMIDDEVLAAYQAKEMVE